jgi:hypothetical protein
VPRQVLADTDLVGALRDLNYAQEEGNRFRRSEGHEAVIDVLTVSQRDRQVESETFGDLTVDAIPGMHVAMMLPATRVEVQAHLRDGTELAMTLDVTDVRAALVMKATRTDCASPPMTPATSSRTAADGSRCDHLPPHLPPAIVVSLVIGGPLRRPGLVPSLKRSGVMESSAELRGRHAACG